MKTGFYVFSGFVFYGTLVTIKDDTPLGMMFLYGTILCGLIIIAIEWRENADKQKLH